MISSICKHRRASFLKHLSIAILAILGYSSQVNAAPGTLCEKVRSIVGSAQKMAQLYPANGPRIQRSTSQLKQLCGNYPGEFRACTTEKDETDTMCGESNDPGVTQFLSMMGSAADMAGLSMSQSCSQLANLMKMGQGALAGVRLNCMTQRSSCVKACDKAEATRKLIEKELRTLDGIVGWAPTAIPQNVSNDSFYGNLDAAKAKHCENPKDRKEPTYEDCVANVEKQHQQRMDQMNSNQQNPSADQNGIFLSMIDEAQQELKGPTDLDSPAGLRKICDNTMKEVMGKIGMNMMSIMSSMQNNTLCKNELQSFQDTVDLSDCNLTGTCKPNDPTNDCADPAYKNSIYCQSGIRGNTNGTTTGGLMGGGGATAGGVNGIYQDPGLGLDGRGTLTNADALGGPGGGGGLDASDLEALSKLGDGGGAKASVPGGGGGGGLGIPGGGYNPGRGGSRGVSSGDGSGVGGNPSYAVGGNMFGGGSGSSKDGLDKYLPGGEKDPSLAKKGIGPEGITSSGGLTLFEKVSKGYRNNRSTLIPE